MKNTNIPQHFFSKKHPMQYSGVSYKGKKYITHTTLHYSQSALQTLFPGQKTFLKLLFISIGLILFVNPLFTFKMVVAVLSCIYFLDMLFNLVLIFKSLQSGKELTYFPEELQKINDTNLPIYTILCPLYNEAHIVPQFLKSISKLDWPKEKLEVLLLLEKDDAETIQAVRLLELPSYVHIVSVPHSLPKTKPKACNYGLNRAKGEYIAIYDAEDKPDPLQLKKAYLGFLHVPQNVVCLQAKLNYYNPHQNLLTRLFTAEYSLWFDLTLTGLQSLHTIIPLGGTSNHFRTDVLRELKGWDPFNVTEDADLGIRLFQKGYQTAIIDSTTLEEANSNIGNWFRQRSRWIKGYMQTYLVHTRGQSGFKKEKGIHALIFHLIFGGKIAFTLINPILWLVTISYFVFRPYIGSTIEALYPASFIFYLAVISLVFGNFLFLFYYMIGCAKREQWDLIKYVFFIPFYWLMMSISSVVALSQLIFKPHYWEKTVHGLHLEKKTLEHVFPKVIIEAEQLQGGIIFPAKLRKRFLALLKIKSRYLTGGLLIGATSAGNFLNFFFNAYLGRVVSFENFSIISLFGGLIAFASTVFGSFGTVVSYRSGFLIGENGDAKGFGFWQFVRRRSFVPAFILTIIWLGLTPFLLNYFHTQNILLFIIFAPVIFYGFAAAADRGFLSSRLMFGWLALGTLIDPIVRVVMAFVFVSLKRSQFAYISLFISFFATFIVGWLILTFKKKKITVQKIGIEERYFPVKFFIISVINSLSLVMFLSLDVVLAKHFLSPIEAGKYALLSLVGKMVYFLASFVASFIMPFVSRDEGAKRDSSRTLRLSLVGTFGLTVLAFLAFGVFGNITIPILYGQKAYAIVSYLPIFTLAMLCFCISRVFVVYYLAKKIYTFPVAGFLVSLFALGLMGILHGNLVSFVVSITSAWFLSCSLMFLLHMNVSAVKTFENNIIDFFGLFAHEVEKKKNAKLRILIFNWRDTKHKWAGGAEVYIHELAKRWAATGNSVTVFCGNSARRKQNEIVQGVQIYRHGGFYTVYAWAFFYYMLKFRGKYDVIIDSENGIPFFTPLYAREKKFLLIHHVHQEVFRKSLVWPLSTIASLLEAKLMPLVYRKVQVITVSPSSKIEILKYKLTKSDPIIIYNGVDRRIFKPGRKYTIPTILYVGRLQYYKSLHILVRAVKRIALNVPRIRLMIAGEGGQRIKLQNYAKKLGIINKIQFLGRVSDNKKVKLYQKAWVFANPSMMEGWGITTIEANACGTPAVASNVPGLRDSIINPHTGLLVKYGNSKALADAITKLIHNKKLRKTMSIESEQWAKNFSWSKSAKLMYKILMSKKQIAGLPAGNTISLAKI